jgi:hypothetical protein
VGVPIVVVAIVDENLRVLAGRLDQEREQSKRSMLAMMLPSVVHACEHVPRGWKRVPTDPHIRVPTDPHIRVG